VDYSAAMMAEKLWYLKRCELLAQLSPADFQLLEGYSRIRVFSRKAPIYLPAEAADAVFVLAEGRVKICHVTSDGKQSILAFIEPGELFGELAVFAPGTRDEHAEALERSTIVMIPSDAFQTLLQQRPELSLGVSKLMGIRRKRIERRLKNLLFVPSRDRLIHLLLELAEQYGKTGDDGVQLGLHLSHQELANVIGSTRETVTVLLRDLQQEGLIFTGRKRITIRDVNRLARAVSAPAPTLPAANRTAPTQTVRSRI
jgi:CRP-like cAMP-binding protein